MELRIRKEVFQTAKEWILEAGKNIRETIDEPLKINTKSNANDLVTQMDQNTEKFFTQKIRSTYPDHYIVSEEGYGDDLESDKGTVWIIDPIDGTMNFVHQKRNFAISIGIYHDGIGEIGFIYDVMNDILYSAEKGEGAFKNGQKIPELKNELVLEESILVINSHWSCENKRVDEKGIQDLVRKVRGTRSYGSAALELAYVAEGVVDGYLTMKLAPWDFAAGMVIVNEVGGLTTKADGQPLDLLNVNTIFSGNKRIHETVTTQYVRLKGE
ncbi:inositol monophosphatase family protein [Sediminibacillus massiliensis]|uniref:inositol monophosphatase family protein n=1 Tax=Sediminibacillus massiliensis TaxID=1926277 RepID=UPI0009886627|nr:inositol monophosphatase family protein [Sediminibacillus massiliensis]